VWIIHGNLGPHSRSGVDARGWPWEIERDGEARRVLVEDSGSALASSEASLPGDTAAAIRTEGHSEIVKVLRLGEPVGCENSVGVVGDGFGGGGSVGVPVFGGRLCLSRSCI
jgi:hypothetical protein